MGQWNSREYFWFAFIVFGWGSDLYSFGTPVLNKQAFSQPVPHTTPAPQLSIAQARRRYEKEHGGQCQSVAPPERKVDQTDPTVMTFVIDSSSQDGTITASHTTTGSATESSQLEVGGALKQQIETLLGCYERTNVRKPVTFKLDSERQFPVLDPRVEIPPELEGCLRDVVLNAAANTRLDEFDLLSIDCCDKRKEEVTGSLPKQHFTSVIHSHVSEVRACYQAALAGWPDLEGMVTVKFIVNTDGSVLSAMVEKSKTTLGHDNVECCIVNALKRWIFAPPEGGGIVVITHPFVLVKVQR